ncbi:hypothetical protein ESCO_005065 [Escovopsis weberi]|uniref:Uncharacterized protein n=1 Tax=Escovopsis weberi TaxID=150374 RepID=A0A0M9VW16_ESCWE|nr:hypothetical protein ESCO_005065 [Escovopsis weberi]
MVPSTVNHDSLEALEFGVLVCLLVPDRPPDAMITGGASRVDMLCSVSEEARVADPPEYPSDST